MNDGSAKTIHLRMADRDLSPLKLKLNRAKCLGRFWPSSGNPFFCICDTRLVRKLQYSRVIPISLYPWRYLPQILTLLLWRPCLMCCLVKILRVSLWCLIGTFLCSWTPRVHATYSYYLIISYTVSSQILHARIPCVHNFKSRKTLY
jgi:hypothetical protein